MTYKPLFVPVSNPKLAIHPILPRTSINFITVLSLYLMAIQLIVQTQLLHANLFKVTTQVHLMPIITLAGFLLVLGR